MKRKIAVVLVGAVLATGLSVAPATAASSGSGGGISHPDITLYKGQHNKTARASYRVKKPTTAQAKACFNKQRSPGERYTGWGDLYWNLDLEYLDRHGNLASGGDYLYKGADPMSGKSSADRWYAWDGFGKYKAKATIERSFEVYVDGEYGADWYDCYLPDTTYSDTFYFKRNTFLSANASPEPVKKGKYVTVKGSLRYWSPGSGYHGAIRPLKDRKVKIYFDPVGSKGATYKGSAKVNSNGAYTKKLRQVKSGTWVVKYAGTSTLRPDQAKDAVKVR